MPDSEGKVEQEQKANEEAEDRQQEADNNPGARANKGSVNGEASADTEEAVKHDLENLVQSEQREGEAVSQAEIDMLMDVDVTVSIELGRTVQPIEEILKLAPGRIIELDRPAGENVDMFLNDKLFARGEVTVIDDNYAVRVTEIVKTK